MSTVPSWPSDRLTRRQAAEFLGLSNQDTLAVWASTGRHTIPYIKIGRLVFYRKSDLEKFIESKTVQGVGY